MKKIFSFDFSPILKFAIQLPEKHCYCIRYFEEEYERTATEIPQEAFTEAHYDIVVYIDADRIPADCHRSKKRVGRVFPLEYAWRFRDGSQERISLYYQTNYFQYFLPVYIPINLQTYLLEPLFFYIGLLKGYMLIHAGSIAKNGAGTIVTAQSGCGKTSLALKLIRRQYDFMGDDLVWVSKRLEIFRYPRRIHLFSYVTQNSKALTLSNKLILVLKFKDTLRKLIEFFLRERFHIATRVDIKNIVPSVSIAETAYLKNFIYMKKEHDKHIEVLGQAGMVRHLSEIAGVNEPMTNLFSNFFYKLDALKRSTAESQNRMLLRLMSSVITIVMHRNTVKTDTLALEKYLHV